jgi:hypothetical protein
MDRIAELTKLVLRAEQDVKSPNVNWATSYLIFLDEAKEILGLNEFVGYHVTYRDGCKCSGEVR